MACAFPVSDLERSSVISERAGNHLARRKRGSRRDAERNIRRWFFGRTPSNHAFRAERGHYHSGAECAIAGCRKICSNFLSCICTTASVQNWTYC